MDPSRKYSIGVVDDIVHTGDGETYFYVREFNTITPVFQKPFSSVDISTWRVKCLAAKDDVRTVCLEEIRGKFYGVHEKLNYAAQPEAKGIADQQSWIVTLLRHSETPP